MASRGRFPLRLPPAENGVRFGITHDRVPFGKTGMGLPRRPSSNGIKARHALFGEPQAITMADLPIPPPGGMPPVAIDDRKAHGLATPPTPLPSRRAACGRSPDAMPKQIRLNAFHMNSPGHSWAGLWTHPNDRCVDYTDLEFWIELARTAERGLFDGLLLANISGVCDAYAGSPDAALAAGAQIPSNDPVVRDKADRVFARPGKVHRIRHSGPHFTLDAIHLSEPSPQRTPPLYQAGTSARGRAFAARHAECVVANQNKRQVAEAAADIRRRARAYAAVPAQQ